MRLSARVDYALRAVTELAAAQISADAAGTPWPLMTADKLAAVQNIPAKFLEGILVLLRRGGIITAQRGPDGGYRLTRPASTISIAAVIRVVDGPLANIRGLRPENLGYAGAAKPLQDVWIALRASEREILDLVTIADVAANDMPARIRDLIAKPEAWA